MNSNNMSSGNKTNQSKTPGKSKKKKTEKKNVQPNKENKENKSKVNQPKPQEKQKKENVQSNKENKPKVNQPKPQEKQKKKKEKSKVKQPKPQEKQKKKKEKSKVKQPKQPKPQEKQKEENIQSNKENKSVEKQQKTQERQKEENVQPNKENKENKSIEKQPKPKEKQKKKKNKSKVKQSITQEKQKEEGVQLNKKNKSKVEKTKELEILEKWFKNLKFILPKRKKGKTRVKHKLGQESPEFKAIDMKGKQLKYVDIKCKIKETIKGPKGIKGERAIKPKYRRKNNVERYIAFENRQYNHQKQCKLLMKRQADREIQNELENKIKILEYQVLKKLNGMHPNDISMIYGRNYTRHAVSRMNTRKITYSDVQNAINNGKKSKEDATTISYKNNSLKVVVNKDIGSVITTYME